MRRITLIMVLALIIETAAIAELPLHEIWSVDLEWGRALGNAWVDEDGNQMVLVGDGWQAKLISNREIIWESDSLIGPVTALIRVPYYDGEQFVVAASEPLDENGTGFGHLYRFGGDGYEQLSDMQLLGAGGGDYWEREYDNRNLVKLAIIPGMLEFDDHEVLAAWDFYSEHNYADMESFYRRSGHLGVVTDNRFDVCQIGVPVGLEVFQDSSDRTRVAFGWWNERVWWYRERGEMGGFACGLTLLYGYRQIVNSVTLAGFNWSAWDGIFPDRNPEFLGMTVVQGDNQPSLFVAYTDDSCAFISEMSVPDLDVIQKEEIPDDWLSGRILSFQWEDEDSTISSLLLIDSDGLVLVIDAVTLAEIEVYRRLPEPYVTSMKTDFEGDGKFELLVLAGDRLTCFSVDPLAAPHENLAPQPSSLILSEPYPNPFNSSTTINYALPVAAPVSLKLYDLSGREVKTLVEGNVQAGVHSVNINANDLVSGLYFVRLEADGQMFNQKIVLIR